MGKVISQVNLGQTRLISTQLQAQHVLHRDHRIKTCRGEASISSLTVFKVGFLQAWTSHRDTRMKKAVVGNTLLSSASICFMDCVLFQFIQHISIEHLL